MIDKLDLRGDPNIGFYGILTNDLFVSSWVSDFRKIRSVRPSHNLFIAGTPFLGLFAVGNENGYLLPEITAEDELLLWKKLGKKIGIIKSRHTALGNLILANDKGAIVSKLLKNHSSLIEEVLDVQVEIGSISDLDIPGSCGIANNKGVLLHREATSEDLKKVADILQVETDVGTLNWGSPYLRSAALVNDKQLLVGTPTSGHELGRAVTRLGIEA